MIQHLIHSGRLAVALSFLAGASGCGKEAGLAARDVAANVGIVFPNRMTQGETPLIDVDRDGFPDIIINGHQRSPVTGGQNLGTWPILRWDGGAFVPYQTIEDLTDRHACAVADFGRQAGTGLPDGIADLYCIHGAAEGNCSTPDRNTPTHARCKHWPNELFLRSADGAFPSAKAAATTYAPQWGVEAPYDRGRDVAVLDFDKDGLPDLALANVGPSCAVETRNRLFRNHGGSFTAVDPSPVCSRQAAVCVEAGDIDGNGWPDLVFCGRKTPVPFAPSCKTLGDDAEVNGPHGIRTFTNSSGVFTDVSGDTAYKGNEVRNIRLRDLNRDAKVDLLFTSVADTLQVWLNDGSGFPSRTWAYRIPIVPDHRGLNNDDDHGPRRADDGGADMEVGDVNLDGWPDIYLMNVDNENDLDEMLLNDGTGTSFTKIEGEIPKPSATGKFEDRATTRGRGDSVTVIPNWRNTGRAAFLVFNGFRQNPGPVQLIEFYDAP